jgi:hypothetical protein
MSKQILPEEFLRMQKLAGIVNEYKIVHGSTYYAIFNYNGKGEPNYYYITPIKEDMIDVLNSAYKKLTGENYTPYSIEDLEDNTYGEKRYDHFINDDWASVTDSREVFERTKSYFDTPPQEYKF